MIQLQDTDPMPYGKYKGAPMQDVPPDYLFWLWTNGKEYSTKVDQVADCINRNLLALEQEYPDGIWRK